ncbi:hypothetical protein D3C86_2191910 [compost metagenome]
MAQAVMQHGAVDQSGECVEMRHELQARGQALALHGRSHLRGDALQHLLVLRGVGMALEHQRAHHALLRDQRHAKPR